MFMLRAFVLVACCLAASTVSVAIATHAPSNELAATTGARRAVHHVGVRPHSVRRRIERRAEPKFLDAATAARLTVNASRDVGISSVLVQAIMNQESARDINARSSAGALGLMQLLPEVAREWGAAKPYDIYQNVYASTRYIAWLRHRYHGDVRLTAAAYNAGPGTVDFYHGVPPYAETKRYVAAVLASLNRSPGSTEE